MVGILGLTNPGIAIWDKANVEGKMEFPGLVEQAEEVRPRAKAKGCDVVVSARTRARPRPRRTATRCRTPRTPPPWSPSRSPTWTRSWSATLTSTSPSGGHQQADGQEVVLCEPLFWGKRVAVFEIDLERHGSRWRARDHLEDAADQHRGRRPGGRRRGPGAARHRRRLRELRRRHLGGGNVRDRAVVEDAPIIDFINYVQADAVKAALTGSDAALPVLSIAAPFNRAASFPPGNVTIRDVAGLYIFDNTLLGGRVTGAQVKDYLEFSAQLLQACHDPGPVPIADVTNAVTRRRRTAPPTTTTTSSPGSTRP